MGADSRSVVDHWRLRGAEACVVDLSISPILTAGCCVWSLWPLAWRAAELIIAQDR
jgi:hypothetical protein